jgi:diguanylate cyclase (GGDEF)-like protein
VRLIFKNLNILRSTINAISTGFEIKDIVEAAGTSLPNLFSFSAFGLFLKTGPLLYLYQEESCPSSLTEEVLKNMADVLSVLGEETAALDRIEPQIVRRKFEAKGRIMDPGATLKSRLTLPLTAEGEIIGSISLNSEKPNAFDVQDLQFFSVIGSQMAATLTHFQRFSSVKNMAIYDTLTNLHNRRYFEEVLGVETQKAFRSGTALSLVLVDIDHFKKVNDTFGHAEGDKVLQEISSRLRTAVRRKDTVARYGGEEFILILPGAGLDESSMIAERIRRLVENVPFDVARARLDLTVSLGISSFPSHQAKSKEDLVRMADQALYDAKGRGRNRVSVFSPGGGQVSQRQR